MNNNKAFSLIELSIVLIIIGLLVAGITGGASLIENAKIKGVIDEFNNYNTSINTFYSLKGRLPGDLNNSGKIGLNSGQSYNNNNFGPNYESNNNQDYGIPDPRIAPFIELYLEKLIDFEPKKTVPASGGLGWANGGSPKSKALDYAGYQFLFVGSPNYNDPSDNLYMEKIGNKFRLHRTGSSNHGQYLKGDMIEKIDLKLDDGKYNSGDIRGECNNTDAYKKGTLCTSLRFSILTL